MRAGSAATLAGCLALLTTACAGPPQRPLPAGDPLPRTLLARWSEQVAGRSGLYGSARLSVDAEGQGGGAETLRVRSKQRVWLSRPARLRVEVQGLLGTTLAVLAVDDDAYAFFEAGSRRFEKGAVHDALLWDVVRLDLRPGEAVEVILGAPRLEAELEVIAAWDAGRGVTRIALGPPGGHPRQSLDLDRDARLLRFEQWGAAETPLWQAAFSDYGPVGSALLAHRVTIETRGGTRAVIALSGVELNPTLSPDIFRLDAIAGQVGAAGEGG